MLLYAQIHGIVFITITCSLLEYLTLMDDFKYSDYSNTINRRHHTYSYAHHFVTFWGIRGVSATLMSGRYDPLVLRWFIPGRKQQKTQCLQSRACCNQVKIRRAIRSEKPSRGLGHTWHHKGAGFWLLYSFYARESNVFNMALTESDLHDLHPNVWKTTHGF